MQQIQVSSFKAIVVLSALCLLLAAVCSASGSAMSLAEQVDQTISRAGSPAATLAIVEQPEITIRVLESLLRSLLFSLSSDQLQTTSSVAQKRGLDLGISRGYSGSQAGKHLMGLSAASFANGPGKR